MRRSHSLLLLSAIFAPCLIACQGDPASSVAALQLGTLKSEGTFQYKGQPDEVRSEPQPAASNAPAAPKVAPATQCSAEIVDKLVSPVSEDSSPVNLTCSAKLPSGSVVKRQVVFSGSAASGASLDCSGGTLEGRGGKGDRESVVIRSTKVGDKWERPTGITVRNCRITNGVRIYGLGRNGEATAVQRSSTDVNHTAFAQAAAPSDVTFDRVEIVGSAGVPFYVSPGVTNVTLSNSTVRGTSSSVAVYLDAESGKSRIINNIFDISTKGREVIAVDGSANNLISGNQFKDLVSGGIFAYRNCGEGGTIRHQAPQFNRIINNTFFMDGSSRAPAVWLNSRNGNRSYCFKDPNHPFGSSLSSLDMAQNNIVEGNRAVGATGDVFRNNDRTNRVLNNAN